MVHVQCLPILPGPREETPIIAVTEARSRRQNGTALMGEGLSSLVSLLHRESKDEIQYQTVPFNDSHVTAPINSSAVEAMTGSSGVQKHSDQPKEDVVSINIKPKEEASRSSSPKVPSNEQEASATLLHSKEVQIHIATNANADAGTPASHKELSSNVVSAALGRKQVVRSQSPSLQRDASQQADSRGMFWLHWELLRLAKPGLLIFGIFAAAVASITFVQSKPCSQEKEKELDAGANERLLAVAKRLHSAKEQNEAAPGVCKNELMQDQGPSVETDGSSMDTSSATTSNSDLQAIQLMDELGFIVPSVDELFIPTTHASQSPRGEVTQPATTATRLSPEMALSEETRKRREAIVNILRNLPDVKDRDSSRN